MLSRALKFLTIGTSSRINTRYGRSTTRIILAAGILELKSSKIRKRKTAFANPG